MVTPMLTDRQNELFAQLHEIEQSIDLTDDLNVHNDGEGFMIGVGGHGHGATLWLENDVARKLASHILDYLERSEAIRDELSASSARAQT